MSMHGMDEEKPSKPVPVTSVFGPMRSQGTEETDGGAEESWHDARDGCEMAYETVDEGTGSDPTEDRTARHYKPCGARSGRGSLDRGLSRHEMPTRKRVRNKTPSSTRREGSAREKVEIREGEDRENGLSPEGSASKPRPRTLENQAQEGLNRLRSVRFPPTPLTGLVAPGRV